MNNLNSGMEDGHNFLTTPKSVVLESRPCPLECRGKDELILKGWDRIHHLPGKYTVVRCKSCGLMRTDPRPTLDTIGYYYPAQYGPYQGTIVTNRNASNGTYSAWELWIKKIFQFHTNTYPDLIPGRLLEIGCASGAFLHKMALHGWKVEGLEFSETAASSARSLGYPVFSGPVEHAPEPSYSYDMIAGWMVLEHLHDPVAALQKLHSWTNKDGWLVISVPNADSLEFRIFEDRWYALQLPTHLFHYTAETLRKVLQKGGWKTVKVFHQRTLSNLIASSGYWLQDHGIWNWLARSLTNYPDKVHYSAYFLYPFALILSLLGQTGRVTVWAKRIN